MHEKATNPTAIMHEKTHSIPSKTHEKTHFLSHFVLVIKNKNYSFTLQMVEIIHFVE